MWTSIAEQTNTYARSKVRTANQGMDANDAITHFSHRQHTFHNIWRDDNSGDIRIFIAYLIIMGLVQKSRIDYYWSTCNLNKTPLFGKYVSCSHFQNILLKLHLSENQKICHLLVLDMTLYTKWEIS